MEEVLTRRRAKRYRKTENCRYAETEKAVQAWWYFKRRIIRPLDEGIEQHVRTY